MEAKEAAAEIRKHLAGRDQQQARRIYDEFVPEGEYYTSIYTIQKNKLRVQGIGFDGKRLVDLWKGQGPKAEEKPQVTATQMSFQNLVAEIRKALSRGDKKTAWHWYSTYVPTNMGADRQLVNTRYADMAAERIVVRDEELVDLRPEGTKKDVEKKDKFLDLLQKRSQRVSSALIALTIL